MPRARSIATVLTAAALVRVAVPLIALAVARPEPQFREPDSGGYLQAAEQLLETGRLGTCDEPEIKRTPGYPLLLVPGLAVGHVEMVTVALQIALACATVWLVYQTATLVYQRDDIALAAAWLCACEPVSMIYASKLLSETLFTTLLTAALWFITRYCAWQRWRDVLLAAAVVAAATYVRPITYFLPVCLAPALLVALGRRDGRAWRRTAQAVAFFALSVWLMAFWQVRNWSEARYTGFAAIADVNLYYYEALPVVAERDGIPPSQWDKFQVAAGESNPAAYLQRHPEQRDWPVAERYAFLRREAWRIIRGDPWRWARLHFGGVAHTLGDSGRNAWVAFFRLADTSKDVAVKPGTLIDRFVTALKQRPLVLVIHGLLATTLLVYLGLASVGLVAVPARTPALLLLLAVGAYLLLLSGGAAGYHRFRLPLVPLISLLAGAGWCWMVARCRR
ncbi:MAG TPA: glycosyltransferase family 39 protein [Pirellulales bacterium]|nr:glycosyltransferase family 39 protein [Pirellulales bacterium]